MSKFSSPPTHAASIESGTMSDAFDDASTVFDETGSLGPFLETRIAEAREKESLNKSVDATFIPETPVSKETFLEERYNELDDEFFEDY